MKSLYTFPLCFLALYFFFPNVAHSETGLDIMKKQKARHEVTSEVEKIKMVLIDSSNKQELREMTRSSKKGSTGLFKYLIQFQSPADVRGTALLTWQQKDREDDQWLYLPAMGSKLKRIAGGGKKSYFMGTDFTYEDLRNEKLDDHAYKLLSEETVENQACYVVEALPGNDAEKNSSAYSKRIFWISKENLATIKTDYYDTSGKLQKTAISYDLKPVKGDVVRPGKVHMKHHQNKHQTIMGTLERKIDEKLDDTIFTERHVLGGN
jgi:hypothetical protein